MTALRIIPFFLLASCFFLACSFAPKPSLPEPVANIPERFVGSSVAGAYEPLEWWRAFADPALDTIVEAVLASNLDLAESVARVQQARARARIARADFFPDVQATGAIDDVDLSVDAGIGAYIQEFGPDGAQEDFGQAFELPDRLALTLYSLSADFAYEFDFWGRVRNDARAAGAVYQASESDLRAARIGILAETITTYFEIADLRRRTALARETVDVLREREELAATRYARGLTDSFELYLLRQDLRNAQAGLPQLESQVAGAEGRLAVLLGGYRADLEAVLPDALSPTPTAAPVPVGIPADLLRQRPDVIAAAQRLDAARYNIGARRAELLPSLSFSMSVGLQNTDAGDVFDVNQWYRNLATNLTAPIFQGGRLKSNVALAQARFKQAAAAYGQTVVTAVGEVETALARLENAGRRHTFLASRLEEARASVTLQSQRYASGVGAYADYLDALRTRLNVESALVGAGRDLALARLAVHRALGGAWTGPSRPAGPRMVSTEPTTKGEER